MQPGAGAWEGMAGKAGMREGGRGAEDGGCPVAPPLLSFGCNEGAFVSNNSPPGATLVFPPPDGATAFEDTPVVLRGQVIDPGSAAEALEFAFISDRDGEPGRAVAAGDGAAELEAVTLSVGEHRVTLQTTDPQGPADRRRRR